MTTNPPDFAQALEKLLNYAQEDDDTLSFTLAHNTDEPIEISFCKETTFEIGELTLLVREKYTPEGEEASTINYLMRINEIRFVQVI